MMSELGLCHYETCNMKGIAIIVSAGSFDVLVNKEIY